MSDFLVSGEIYGGALDRIAVLEAENKRLNARLAYLTIDCDEYAVFNDGRCHRYEQDTICPREPRCHDQDRLRAERGTP